jgi:hypothetical protein
MTRLRRTFAAGLRVRALRLYHNYLREKTPQERGLRLLRSWLSPAQRAQFDSEGQFDVTGSDSGRRYRISYGTSANVHEVDEAGRLGTGWCFVPEGGLSVGDVMLAQKIALETSEMSAMSIARRFPLSLFSQRRGRV